MPPSRSFSPAPPSTWRTTGTSRRRNQKLLHARGIQLKPLGLVTYGEWLKKNRRTRAQATNPHGVPQTPEAAPGVHGHI
jgi:hypothetical protein